MELNIPLQIQINGIVGRYNSQLIGMESGKYVIIKLPIKEVGNTSKFIVKGNKVIVRYMNKGTIYGFESHILKAIFNPAKLLFIKYPEKIEDRKLRDTNRIDCYLPGSIRIVEDHIEGYIMDISKHGCQFAFITEKYQEKDNLLQQNNVANLTFKLPGIENELTVFGKLKKIVKGQTKSKIGIQFVKIKSEINDKLNEYLSCANIC